MRKNLVNKFKTIKAIDRSFKTHGVKLVALIRLSMLVPFNGSNYVLGMTSLSLKDYTLGSLAILPNTIIIVVIGSGFTRLAEIFSGKYKGSWLYAIAITVSILAAIVIIILLVIYTRKEFLRIT